MENFCIQNIPVTSNVTAMNPDGLPAPALQVSAGRTFPGYDTDILNQALIHESLNIKVDKTLSGEILRYPIPCENKEGPSDYLAIRQTKTKWFDTYVPGFVRNVTPNCLEQFVKIGKDIEQPTGCIVNEHLSAEGEDYIEDIHYLPTTELGRGAYGRVTLCKDTVSRKEFVRKTVKKSKLRSSEVIVPLNLNHRNLTRVYGLIQQPDGVTVDLLLEYAGQSLSSYLEDNSLTEKQIWHLTEQCADGLAHMDHYGMIHFDIKPENLCLKPVGANLMAKITDFGSSKLQQESVTFHGWTPEYMAPESCRMFLLCKLGDPEADNVVLTGKVDVFALQLLMQYMYRKTHVLLSFITQGRQSYAGIDEQKQKELRQNIILLLATKPDFMSQLMYDACGLDMKELLNKMAAYLPEERWSAKEVLAFAKGHNEKIKNREKMQYQSAVLRQMATVTQPTRRDDCNQVPTHANIVPEIAQNKMNEVRRPVSMVKERLREKINSPYMVGKSTESIKGKKRYTEQARGKGKQPTPQTPVEELRELTLTCRHTDGTAPQKKCFQRNQPHDPPPVPREWGRSFPPQASDATSASYPPLGLDDILEVCNEGMDTEDTIPGNVPKLDMLL